MKKNSTNYAVCFLFEYRRLIYIRAHRIASHTFDCSANVIPTAQHRGIKYRKMTTTTMHGAARMRIAWTNRHYYYLFIYFLREERMSMNGINGFVACHTEKLNSFVCNRYALRISFFSLHSVALSATSTVSRSLSLSVVVYILRSTRHSVARPYSESE